MGIASYFGALPKTEGFPAQIRAHTAPGVHVTMIPGGGGWWWWCAVVVSGAKKIFCVDFLGPPGEISFVSRSV